MSKQVFLNGQLVVVNDDFPNTAANGSGYSGTYTPGPPRDGLPTYTTGAPGGGGGGTTGSLIPNMVDNNNLMKGLLGGKSPFASSDWNGLIQQLQDRANGTGDSLAKQNYNMASQNTTNSIASMARGSGNPGSAQQAMIQMGRVGQGQAAGLAQAGTQEQMGAQEGLTKALNNRDMINSGAYQNILSQMLGLNNNEFNASIGKDAQNNQSSAMNYQTLASLAGIIAMLV